jgi:hypothetical protein
MKEDAVGETRTNGGRGDEYRISVGPLQRSRCECEDNIKTEVKRN